MIKLVKLVNCWNKLLVYTPSSNCRVLYSNLGFPKINPNSKATNLPTSYYASTLFPRAFKKKKTTNA